MPPTTPIPIEPFPYQRGLRSGAAADESEISSGGPGGEEDEEDAKGAPISPCTCSNLSSSLNAPVTCYTAPLLHHGAGQAGSRGGSK